MRLESEDFPHKEVREFYSTAQAALEFIDAERYPATSQMLQSILDSSDAEKNVPLQAETLAKALIGSLSLIERGK